jgi:predicted aspartyl protease
VIAVSASSGPSTFFDAVIDTGFTGFAQLPTPVAQELGLTPRTASETLFRKTLVLSIAGETVLLVDSLADLSLH